MVRNQQPGMVSDMSETAPKVEAKRITMWNTTELRKLSGNSAPKASNVEDYMRRHPHMVIYTGQQAPAEMERQKDGTGIRVAIWNKTVLKPSTTHHRPQL